MRWFVIVANSLFAAALALFLTGSAAQPASVSDEARAYTRPIEFDYVNWTLEALFVRAEQGSLDIQRYLPAKEQHDLVISYIHLVTQVQDLNDQITRIYADPAIKDARQASASQREELAKQEQRLNSLSPVVENILQSQVASVLASQGLTLGGQPIPPVLYHVTPLPYALIVSPRSVIREEANISLNPGMNVDQMNTLENRVSQGLNVSALVVPVGGIGIYPTMVMQTSDLSFLLETISHEWTHNFLTLRPLGVSYDASPALRTMNETTASIVGKEIGMETLRRYYPELAPPPGQPGQQPGESAPAPKPAFDFNAQMHATRVEVDRLLSEGKITQAEQYMDARRLVFWDHGYLIRKLNQAYFAFYGAYADVPGGTAGNDPVGPAVRRLRAESPNLAAFLNRISWMTSFDQLQRAVAAAPSG